MTTPASTVMIGAFPPPVGGAAKNNLLLFQELTQKNADVTAINVGAATLSHRRSLAFHLQRIARNLLGLVSVARAAKPGARLYMVPDGGLGAWYSMGHALVAKLLPFERFVIHHRTFRYVDAFSKPIWVLTRASRARATHVFLSAEMSRRFQERYGPVDSLIAGNARFVHEEATGSPSRRHPGPLRIGHLSNLCWEKGFFDVADAYEAFVATGAPAELHLAGPLIEPEVGSRLGALQERYGDSVRHIGAVAGEAKVQFYRGLDVFLFPTRFEQEAAPNVVYEALAAGVPVVATGRGCLPEMITGERGVVTPSVDEFPTAATEFMSAVTLEPRAALRRAQTIKVSVAAEGAWAANRHIELLRLLGVDPQ